MRYLSVLSPVSDVCIAQHEDGVYECMSCSRAGGESRRIGLAEYVMLHIGAHKHAGDRISEKLLETLVDDFYNDNQPKPKSKEESR